MGALPQIELWLTTYDGNGNIAGNISISYRCISLPSSVVNGSVPVNGPWTTAPSSGICDYNWKAVVIAGAIYEFRRGNGPILEVPIGFVGSQIVDSVLLGVDNSAVVPSYQPLQIFGSLVSGTALVLSSPSMTPTAGRLLSFTATRNGGTAWTNGTSQTYPLTLSGQSGIIQCSQTVTNGNTCICSAYLADFAGTINLTDTINSATAQIVAGNVTPTHPTTGTTRYIQAGIPNVLSPKCTIVGTPGSQQFLYQVVAHTANGTTCGDFGNPSSLLNNLPVSAANIAFWDEANRTTVVNNAPDILSVSNYVAITILAVPGAISYDVYRALNNNSAPSWVLVANTTGLTINDDGSSSYTPQTPPITNTTSTGSDSNLGTEASPFLTLYHAMSQSSAGDAINVLNYSGGSAGMVCDTNQVIFKNGVNVVGNGKFNTYFYSTYSDLTGNTVSYVLPSAADVTDCHFLSDLRNQPILGAGVSDPLFMDCNLYRVNVTGLTNAFRIGASNSSVNKVDCQFNSRHGTCGILAAATGITMNATRCTYTANAGPVSADLPFNLAGGSFVMLRDCVLQSTCDTMQNLGSTSYAFNASYTGGPSGAVIINGNAISTGFFAQEWHSTATNFTAWMKNTSFGVMRNPTFVTPAGTPLNVGQYLIDPVAY
jgi:hypothetical protein